MKQFLRGIRQGRWATHPDVSWLESGELQGDVFNDIQTAGGKLSVFEVASEEDKKRTIAALTATKENITNMDYAVFENSDLRSLGITMQESKGDTADETVNKMHYELGNLTASRLVKLAEIISAGEHKRIRRNRIKIWLGEAMRNGNLNTKDIKNSGMREECERLGRTGS